MCLVSKKMIPHKINRLFPIYYFAANILNFTGSQSNAMYVKGHKLRWFKARDHLLHCNSYSNTVNNMTLKAGREWVWCAPFPSIYGHVYRPMSTHTHTYGVNTLRANACITLIHTLWINVYVLNSDNVNRKDDNISAWIDSECACMCSLNNEHWIWQREYLEWQMWQMLQWTTVILYQ